MKTTYNVFKNLTWKGQEAAPGKGEICKKKKVRKDDVILIRLMINWTKVRLD